MTYKKNYASSGYQTSYSGIIFSVCCSWIGFCGGIDNAFAQSAQTPHYNYVSNKNIGNINESLDREEKTKPSENKVQDETATMVEELKLPTNPKSTSHYVINHKQATAKKPGQLIHLVVNKNMVEKSGIRQQGVQGVILSTQAEDELIKAVVNNKNIKEANMMVEKNGTIYLESKPLAN